MFAGHMPEVVLIGLPLALIILIAWTLWRFAAAFLDALRGR